MATFGEAFIKVGMTWTNIKAIANSKVIPLQYDTLPDGYQIYCVDHPIAYIAFIYLGTVPDSIVNGGYSQSQNDSDKTDFTTSYQNVINKPIDFGAFNDPRIIRKTGQVNTTSTSGVIVNGRNYQEQASQAQRSIVSTSATDSNGAGTGARTVRITYLDSNYVLKTEDVNTNGTTAVNTVATDIRFIEDFKVIAGSAAVGAIKLMTATAGGGSEFCGISAQTDGAYICHHYVPAGNRAFILGWGTITDDDSVMSLKTQERIGAFLVDRITDTDRMTGITAGARLESYKTFQGGVAIGEKTYIRVFTTPAQATSTNTRAYLIVWEDKA